MTSIRKLASALCLAIFCSFSSAQQIDSTGNLINNNGWSGATYGADPNNCCTSVSGSGALYDTSTNTIMFSYGVDTLVQTIGLQQALGGTGVQVHGYNYSFDYRLMPNSGLHTDNLTASIWLTTSSGFNTEATHLFLSGQVASGVNDKWNSVSGTRNFESPYTDPQSVTMRLEGRDGGFWAGYYGPEVKNISLSVNYAFDPCSSDPLYSSSCPGYLEAYMANLFALLGWSSTPEPEVAVIDYSLPVTTISAMPEDSTTAEPVVDAGGVEVSTTGELSVPDGIPEVVKEDKEKKSIDPNLLSNILREATDDSKALSIVNQSIQDSMSEDANPDFSMTNETLQAIQQQTERSQQQAMQAQESLLQEQANQMSDVMQMESSEATQGQLVVEEVQQSVDIISIDTPIQIQQTIEANMYIPEMPVEEEAQTNTSEVDALAVIQNSLPSVTEDIKQEKEVSVNQKAEPNEAASGTDIADIAVSPTGFNDYLTKSLVDSQFYQDKEIYAGQVVVDNRRAQRLLSGASDRLHREMVDQQYRQ